MIERFKPAGHKAQELSEIVMPEEVFPPIQRVIDTTLTGDDKTIGYLYRDIEYKKGLFGGVVLSAGVLLDAHNIPYQKNADGWKEYEQNEKDNPLKWFIPSGPLTTEIMYRTRHENSPLGDEADKPRQTTLPDQQTLMTSTIITAENGLAHIMHNWNEPPITTNTTKENWTTISEENDPITEKYLHAIIGKRFNCAYNLFRQYGTPVMMWKPKDRTYALVLTTMYTGFHISAYHSFNFERFACGVSLLENFPSPRYEVRDA